MHKRCKIYINLTVLYLRYNVLCLFLFDSSYLNTSNNKAIFLYTYAIRGRNNIPLIIDKDLHLTHRR